MDGSNPHMLDEEALVAVLDPNALNTEARQHLAECPACTERAASYQRVMSTFTSKLYRWDCPDTQEISDYAAGWLRGKRRRVLTLHLKRCPRCTAELAISQQFLAPTPLPLVPRQRLFAQLVPHRAAGAASAGLRGGSSEENEGWPRQYQTSDISLSLHRAAQSVGGSGAMLIGLISRAAAPLDIFTDVEIRLIASDAPDEPPIAIEQIDEDGNFAFSPIPTGRFDLVIVLPEGDLVIEGLELRG
jgi:anti-sigma factor RsiW